MDTDYENQTEYPVLKIIGRTALTLGAGLIMGGLFASVRGAGPMSDCEELSNQRQTLVETSNRKVFDTTLELNRMRRAKGLPNYSWKDRAGPNEKSDVGTP